MVIALEFHTATFHLAEYVGEELNMVFERWEGKLSRPLDLPVDYMTNIPLDHASSQKPFEAKAHEKRLEDLGFLLWDQMFSPSKKRFTHNRYVYDPTLVEEVRKEREERSD